MKLLLESKKYIIFKTTTLFTLGLTVSLAIAPPLAFAPIVLAQTPGAIKFPPAPQRGGPSSTIGGGRRLIEDLPDNLRGVQESTTEPGNPNQSQTCVAPGSKPLTALLPTALGYEAGITSLANPNLYFYLPQTTARQMEFVLKDANNNKLYGSVYSISGQPGIFQLSLPDNVSLEKGKDYQWELAILCNPQKRQADKYIQGKLQRRAISPELQAQIERTAIAVEKAKLYAQAEIWQEALTTLAQAYASDPQAWKALLTSAGLGEFAQAPFLNCCTAAPSPSSVKEKNSPKSFF